MNVHVDFKFFSCLSQFRDDRTLFCADKTCDVHYVKFAEYFIKKEVLEKASFLYR